MDTCTECGETKSIELFVKGRHVCKACKATYDMERNLKNKVVREWMNVDKTCNTCGFTGPESMFAKGRNWCKRCKADYEQLLRIKRRINNGNIRLGGRK